MYILPQPQNRNLYHLDRLFESKIPSEKVWVGFEGRFLSSDTNVVGSEVVHLQSLAKKDYAHFCPQV